MFSNFNINWSLFIKRNVDGERRQPLRLAWLYALLYPVINNYNQFIIFKDATLNRLKYNAQVIYLEKGLNDTFNGGNPAWIGAYNPANEYPFGLTMNGICITEPPLPIKTNILYSKVDSVPGLVLYATADAQPPAHFALYSNSDYANAVDYIINVPSGIVLTSQKLSEIKAFVLLYNKAGSRFSIINY